MMRMILGGTILVCVFAGLGCGHTARSVEPPASADASPIKVHPSTTISKRAKPGEAVTAAFTLENVSTAPLKLLGAKTSCGCTVAEGLPLDLMPGDTGEVRLVMKVEADTHKKRIAQEAVFFVNRDVAVPTLTIEAIISND